MQVNSVNNIYFLGIGGIGMSALAFYFLHKGCAVRGYDKTRTPLTCKLEAAGAIIHYEEDVSKVPLNTDLVVYTPAISNEHKEWELIRQLNVPILKRAELLGMCTEGYNTIAVAGSHGKTTTSSMIAFLLNETFGCHAFLGGVANNYETNFIDGKGSKWLVTEADEYDRSFLQLRPLYSVVTAMDPDHLDIYGNVDNMREAYVAFMKQTDTKNGGIIIKSDLEAYIGNMPIFKKYNTDSSVFEPNVYACNICIKEGSYIFDYVSAENVLKNLCLTYPGKHNVENALAAITIALACGVKSDDIRELLPKFRGVKRRFDIKIRRNDLVYVDDYAHHPDEIKACLLTLKEMFPNKSIRLVFQPHLYSRTKDLAEAFAKSMQIADEVILIDIYPAREKPIDGVSSETIGSLMSNKKVIYSSLSNAVNLLKSMPKPEVLVSMGAGNIDSLVEPISELYLR